MSVHKTACVLCSLNCGLEIEIQDGRISKVRGDTQHPSSQGYICNKAARLAYYQDNEERLTYPLKRQEDGRFARISWDQAIAEIAAKLLQIRDTHGGDAFATVGGGGQGNHLGGFYSRQLRAAMGSRFSYNSLGQEKTGDFWVNGRLFGAQTCHSTEDVEHADYVLLIGCNPYHSHGIPRARDQLKALKRNPARTLVVVDPRRTETAEMADIHLQLRPGADAYLLLAMLAIIVREGLHNQAFIDEHCTGFDEVRSMLEKIPIGEYARLADLTLEKVERVARGFAGADHACVRVDLGTQHSANTTLNAYLEKLLYLITGNFGRQGGNNLHASLIPLLSNTDERKETPDRPLKRTAYHGMQPIAGIYPPNILPDEILLAGDRRIRAVLVDSTNPALNYADSQAQEAAFKSLELLVVVDVAMTETARLAHYILPAASQFEKVEATGFNLEFPRNYFHLRQPLLPPLGETLPEPEIYTRLLETMGLLPLRHPWLSLAARLGSGALGRIAYLSMLMLAMRARKRLRAFAPSLMYRSLGTRLGRSAAAAPLLPLAVIFALSHGKQVRRSGHKGFGIGLGASLFQAIVRGNSGVEISVHDYGEMWRLIKTPDRKVHLAIHELLAQADGLQSNACKDSPQYPIILMAGERRAYNANQIFRGNQWRKTDPAGSLRMHPKDAMSLGITDGSRVTVSSQQGAVDALIRVDDSLRRGVVTLPHGYGQQGADGTTNGPAINRLTSLNHCEPFTKTPYHKHVSVNIVPIAD